MSTSWRILAIGQRRGRRAGGGARGRRRRAGKERSMFWGRWDARHRERAGAAGR